MGSHCSKNLNEHSTERNRDNKIAKEISHVQKLHTIERLWQETRTERQKELTEKQPGKRV